LVTSRILRLDGVDEHNANTRDPFICIHGTKHEGKIDKAGEPRIRADAQCCVIESFDLVEKGAPVVRLARAQVAKLSTL
jgi:hypothetical protein